VMLMMMMLDARTVFGTKTRDARYGNRCTVTVRRRSFREIF
jgi:hypothetical protein